MNDRLSAFLSFSLLTTASLVLILIVTLQAIQVSFLAALPFLILLAMNASIAFDLWRATINEIRKP